MTTTYKVEQLTGTTMNFTGEAPYYDGETYSLYWTDIVGGQIFRMDTTTTKLYTARILGETYISFIIPVEGTTTQFIIGAGKRLLLINWDGVHTTAQIIRILAELTTTGVRFNDAKTDTQGRLYVGTMISEETGNIFDTTKRVGSLYRFTMTEGLTELKTKVGLSNGIAFNDQTNTMYFVDSYDLNIKQFFYDGKTGNITNEKILTDITSYGTTKTNVPDGLTIDTDGNLYVAMFGGGRILKINTTTGKVTTEIKLPVPQVTSMTFGGKNYDTMFVTTAGLDVTGPQTYPSGYMFKVTGLGVQGTETTKFETT
ncbi:CLUMA_CG006919, isoform A [Clunio marinus]|uniref:CLUMA_CG006919, isoform A n=1 Tax=Clunio marinus TaxID=568069 RepID=A0A1J1HZ53_9DIPT|nr:CLUMA_CG006919, isoform A [Clunio marinus]